MTEFRARIGRIRMKNGGADVRILDRQTPNPGGENYCGKVVENAKAVASFSTEKSPLIGYLLVGFYGDASTSADSTACKHSAGRSLERGDFVPISRLWR